MLLVIFGFFVCLSFSGLVLYECTDLDGSCVVIGAIGTVLSVGTLIAILVLCFVCSSNLIQQN